jgi:hypothetical protein
MKRGVLALAVAAGLLATAITATAGDVTGRDRVGDVGSAGLTKAERAALDVVSLRAIGEEGLGVVVVATFRGNVEKALGRGHLAQGAVAMILRPKNPALAPAVLATRGTSPDAALRKTRSEQVGAARSGRTIMFFVGGAGYSNVGHVEIRSFGRLPLGSGRAAAAGGPPQLTDAEFKKIANLKAQDELVVLADAGRLTCEQLESVNKGLLFYVAALVGDDFRRGVEPANDRDLQQLQGFQVAIKTRLDDQCGGLPKTVEAQFGWSFFGTSPNEVTGKGVFGELSGRKVIAITIRVPGHDIDAALCPPQLPRLSFLARDQIKCDGGEIPEGTEFSANVRTSPDPEKQMGGELTATLDDGSTVGPFQISGP